MDVWADDGSAGGLGLLLFVLGWFAAFIGWFRPFSMVGVVCVVVSSVAVCCSRGDGTSVTVVGLIGACLGIKQAGGVDGRTRTVTRRIRNIGGKAVRAEPLSSLLGRL